MIPVIIVWTAVAFFTGTVAANKDTTPAVYKSYIVDTLAN